MVVLRTGRMEKKGRAEREKREEGERREGGEKTASQLFLKLDISLNPNNISLYLLTSVPEIKTYIVL